MVIITSPTARPRSVHLRFCSGASRAGAPLRRTSGPKAALEALADQNIPFVVKGKATYEQQMAAIRGAASRPVQ